MGVELSFAFALMSTYYFLPALLVVALSIAVVTDLRSHKIYNWLTFPLIVLGLGGNTLQHGSQGLLFSVEGVGVACLALLLFLLRGLGAGDLKLLWGVGALMGPTFTLWAVLCTTVGGGVLGLIYALSHGVLGYTVKNALTGGHIMVTMKSLDADPAMAGASKAGKMPYAPAIALGAAVAAYLLHTGVVR